MSYLAFNVSPHLLYYILYTKFKKITVPGHFINFSSLNMTLENVRLKFVNIHIYITVLLFQFFVIRIVILLPSLGSNQKVSRAIRMAFTLCLWLYSFLEVVVFGIM